MKHLIFFLYFVVFAVGFGTAGLFLFIYTRFKNKLSKYYSFLLFSMTFIFLSDTLLFYILTNLYSVKYPVCIIINATFTLSGALFVYFLPLFIHNASIIIFSKKYAFISGVLSVTMIVLFELYFFSGLNHKYSLIINLLVLLVISYCLTLLVRSLKGEKDNEIIKIKKMSFFIIIIYLPLLALDTILSRIKFLQAGFPYGLLAFPLFYFLVNIFSVYYAFKYINETRNKLDIEVNDLFIHKYSVTRRESEIVSLLLKGHSYDEIANQLTISMPTVKTHISNIYKKTGIKNKIELLNSVKECNFIQKM